METSIAYANEQITNQDEALPLPVSDRTIHFESIAAAVAAAVAAIQKIRPEYYAAAAGAVWNRYYSLMHCGTRQSLPTV